MPLSQKQLSTHLKQTLLPLYLISGDEPLLVQETRDMIFIAAKSRGFSEKEVCHVDSGFCTNTFIESLQNQNLFSTKKIMDIRNPAAKMDATLSAFFEAYLTHPTDDRLIVISTDKLSAAQQKAAWFQLINQKAIYIPIWPIQSSELPTWIIERAHHKKLTIPIEIAQMLAHFSEGNLLSTQQAIQKLTVLYPNATITREQLITVLSDHARFGIFDLSDALASRNPKKIMRILARLEQTGEEPTLVLWAICRKLRENSASEHTKKALQKAAHVDEIIKGGKTGNVWQALLELCL